jgi:hypothetical protein
MSAPDLAAGWTAEGPYFKGPDQYLSSDGTNPEAPWPGYGWPLGTECWFFILRGNSRVIVTGLTAESAARRMNPGLRIALGLPERPCEQICEEFIRERGKA